MRKAYNKPWVEVMDFESEAVMTDGEIIFSLNEGVEDGGEV